MFIKLRCSNSDCAYCYEISEKELMDNGHLHKTCLMCGSKLEVINLDEIVATDIEQRADDYLHKWFNSLGIEATVELIERSPVNGVRDLYLRKLKERGLIQ